MRLGNLERIKDMEIFGIRGAYKCIEVMDTPDTVTLQFDAYDMDTLIGIQIDMERIPQETTKNFQGAVTRKYRTSQYFIPVSVPTRAFRTPMTFVDYLNETYQLFVI
jgi:hypothetical protein